MSLLLRVAGNCTSSCGGLACLRFEQDAEAALRDAHLALARAETRAADSVAALRALVLIPIFRAGGRGLLAERVAARSECITHCSRYIMLRSCDMLAQGFLSELGIATADADAAVRASPASRRGGDSSCWGRHPARPRRGDVARGPASFVSFVTACATRSHRSPAGTAATAMQCRAPRTAGADVAPRCWPGKCRGSSAAATRLPMTGAFLARYVCVEGTSLSFGIQSRDRHVRPLSGLQRLRAAVGGCTEPLLGVSAESHMSTSGSTPLRVRVRDRKLPSRFKGEADVSPRQTKAKVCACSVAHLGLHGYVACISIASAPRGLHVLAPGVVGFFS